ncbi:MAG: cellulase family glycosylhydrolase [Dyadobacter sp.]|uniref:glycoside hydrolase family 5 protein n=1 Tax=Dyadobacter sp. TaxID=1914288 RepID=UPI00326543E1
MKTRITTWIFLLTLLGNITVFGQDIPPLIISSPLCRNCPVNRPFQTVGKQLFDPCEAPVVLKGVNKMVYFDSQDPDGSKTFREIRSIGANCVRIVWQMRGDNNGPPSSVALLDKIITNAKANNLIPIVGLWDYTGYSDGGFSKLDEYTAFWTRRDVVRLVQKHRSAMILNIANEAGMHEAEYNVDSLNMYAAVYKAKIRQIRAAHIDVPIMIDGMDQGKSLHCFAVKGREIANDDPAHNVIFSFHPYWPKSATGGTSYIADKFAEVDTITIPIVMGEVSKYGASDGSGASVCSPAGIADYEQFIKRADAAGMGWLIWEWGPGNKDGIIPCPQMDMTSDGRAATIGANPGGANSWVSDVALTASYSVRNTAKRTGFIMNGFKACP